MCMRTFSTSTMKVGARRLTRIDPVTSAGPCPRTCGATTTATRASLPGMPGDSLATGYNTDCMLNHDLIPSALYWHDAQRSRQMGGNVGHIPYSCL